MANLNIYMNADNTIKAKHLYEIYKNYSEVARQMNISPETVRLTLDPKAKQQQIERDKNRDFHSYYLNKKTNDPAWYKHIIERTRIKLQTPEECYKELKIKNDGILTIQGIMTGDGEASYQLIKHKLSVIGVTIVATENEELKTTFENTIKEYLSQIKEIKYDCIFTGKNINACYNPSLVNTKMKEGDYLPKYTKNDFIKLVQNDADQMKSFLFCNESSLYGYAYRDG